MKFPDDRKPAEPTLSPRKDWPLVERVRVLQVGPDDTLVLECPDALSPEEVVELRAIWADRFPELRFPLVLSGPITLAAVLRQASR